MAGTGTGGKQRQGQGRRGCRFAGAFGQTFFQNITFQFINIDYSDKFEGAIEDKVIAEQKAQEAVNNTKRIKEEAEQKLISAKAEAEAMEIKSEALSKTKALRSMRPCKMGRKITAVYAGQFDPVCKSKRKIICPAFVKEVLFYQNLFFKLCTKRGGCGH